jgi:hypothetical protein
MGNRANLVLVDRDGWQLRYSHWAGCRMLDALLAGPDMAGRYIRVQEVGNFWTDELWADGGLVLDLDKRKLVFFGEELMATMNERRAMFEVLAITWPGYSTSWAYEATAEIAAYVGASLPLRDRPSQPELLLADDTTRLHHLVTVLGPDGTVRAWPLWWGITAPELDVTSGVVEAEAWLRKRVFQSYEDSPAGCVSRLAALFGSLEPVSSVTAPATERPNDREWAGFERACALVRHGRRAA